MQIRCTDKPNFAIAKLRQFMSRSHHDKLF